MGCTWGAAAPDLDSEFSHHHCPCHPVPTHCPPLGVSCSSGYPEVHRKASFSCQSLGRPIY